MKLSIVARTLPITFLTMMLLLGVEGPVALLVDGRSLTGWWAILSLALWP
jgi:hypothetical protein